MLFRSSVRELRDGRRTLAQEEAELARVKEGLQVVKEVVDVAQNVGIDDLPASAVMDELGDADLLGIDGE